MKEHQMTQFLVIDIGNSQTKWAVASSRSVGNTKETPSTVKSIRSCFKKNCGMETAVISSVVPSLNPVLRKALARAGFKHIHFISEKTDLGIGIRYPQPHTIGADRLANAVAVSHHFGAPSIVIDFGTAVTFDIVSRRYEYIGGVICPGLKSMTEYLHDQTALLPRVSLKEPHRMVGKNTIEAMRIGAVIGFRGLITEILHAIKVELHSHRVPVVATGGYSALIAKKVHGITAVRPKLTLEGLRLIGLHLS